MLTSFPLDWISKKPRTLAFRRSKSQFKVSFKVAKEELIEQLLMLEAKNIVLSSNTVTRHNGLPYNNRDEPDDPGVVVYFTIFKKDYAIGCDKWDRVKDNIRAISKYLEGLSAIGKSLDFSDEQNKI